MHGKVHKYTTIVGKEFDYDKETDDFFLIDIPENAKIVEFYSIGYDDIFWGEYQSEEEAKEQIKISILHNPNVVLKVKHNIQFEYIVDEIPQIIQSDEGQSLINEEK